MMTGKSQLYEFSFFFLFNALFLRSLSLKVRSFEV